MTDAQTQNQLEDLKLRAMLKALNEQDRDPFWSQQDFESRFAHLVNAQHEDTLNRRINYRLKQAGFKQKALLSEIIFNSERNLSKEFVERLASHNYLKNKENIIITGATGTGKSYLAQALGDHACRFSYRVLYYRLPDLLLELNYGKELNTYRRLRKKIKNAHLLILDDWGLAELDMLSGREIGEIIEDRLNVASTIVVSQYPVGTWDKIFRDKTTADAVMDRLIHRAYLVELKGPSLRAMGISEDLQKYKSMLE